MIGRLEICEALSRADVGDFLELPYRLYAGHPHWVPPLRSAQRKVFTRKTAFFEHGQMALFLARRDGQAVGRIAAIHNHAHNRQHNDRVGFFGFFEVDARDEQATEVVDALVRSAERWLTGHGLTDIRGPVNPSMNGECGLLIDGFDLPPVALMPYNPPEYAPLLESAGLAKCKDLFAYEVVADKVEGGAMARERMERLRTLTKRRHPELEIRPIDMRNFDTEIERFMAVFEQARRNNWGYVPVTSAEMRETAHELKGVVDPEIILLATVDGQPAGASLAIPDVNRGLAAAGGRLLPLGFVRFLRAMRSVHVIRVIGIAALPQYRHMGIAALLMLETISRGLPKGYDTAEASWVLEDNVMSNRTIQAGLESRLYKTYRLYEKTIER
ncbi:MAG: hypothetical protein BWX88_00820 [Planctomycetes bacterium ADurb.Bin126]|mgnify:CR=1 FL=1|nr:MAG: hypothetical protein BWX88_00820 [Planctomycetes bacterium ADurb.Bin126]HOD80247.1 GNAT family N-acetyltransferase [Phycisphaerae bacterium]HQL72204.1 GNAT family N-acetyltransferase [Phycisphaerae bacterium]